MFGFFQMALATSNRRSSCVEGDPSLAPQIPQRDGLRLVLFSSVEPLDDHARVDNGGFSYGGGSPLWLPCHRSRVSRRGGSALAPRQPGHGRSLRAAL